VGLSQRLLCAPDGAVPEWSAAGTTPGEREILALVSGGWTNRRIAAALFIGESTASVHVSNILGKLGATNRLEAASIAVRLRVDPPRADTSRG